MRSGGTPKSDNINYYSGDIPFISIPDMKSKYLTSSKKFINELAIKNSSAYTIKKDSLLLSAYATIGEICINKIDVALPQSIFGIVFKDNLILEYMYYIFLKSKSKFIKMQQVGSQPNISLDIIKKININITYDIEEQTKIAKFFTLLDKQIDLLVHKLQLLEVKKKYYLNNLFSSNDLLIPNLRFKGFVEKNLLQKLKDFSIVKCGKTPSTKDSKYWENGIFPFVTPTDIINMKIQKIERHVTNDGLKKSQIALQGSIFVTCVASIGKNAICNVESSFNQQINNIYSEIYNNKYLYYLICKNDQLIKSNASKSATQIIKKSDFENINFYLTKDLNEQTKIAKFFTLLDKQIENNKNKKEKIINKKTYYLNNMFI